MTYIEESSDTAEVLGVSVGAGRDLPLILSRLELGGHISIDVDVASEEVVLLELDGKLVVGEGPVGLDVILVNADLAFSLAGVHLVSILPLRLVGHRESGALSKINTKQFHLQLRAWV